MDAGGGVFVRVQHHCACDSDSDVLGESWLLVRRQTNVEVLTESQCLDNIHYARPSIYYTALYTLYMYTPSQGRPASPPLRFGSMTERGLRRALGSIRRGTTTSSQ